MKELERQSKLIRQEIPEQFMVLVICKDEKQQQIELIERFVAEGLECKALLS